MKITEVRVNNYAILGKLNIYIEWEGEKNETPPTPQEAADAVARVLTAMETDDE